MAPVPLQEYLAMASMRRNRPRPSGPPTFGSNSTITSNNITTAEPIGTFSYQFYHVSLPPEQPIVNYQTMTEVVPSLPPDRSKYHWTDSLDDDPNLMVPELVVEGIGINEFWAKVVIDKPLSDLTRIL